MRVDEYLTELHTEANCPCWQYGGCADAGGCGGCCAECPRCRSRNVTVVPHMEEPEHPCPDCGLGT